MELHRVCGQPGASVCLCVCVLIMSMVVGMAVAVCAMRMWLSYPMEGAASAPAAPLPSAPSVAQTPPMHPPFHPNPARPPPPPPASRRQDVLDLIEARMGILDLLDETCRFPKASFFFVFPCIFFPLGPGFGGVSLWLALAGAAAPRLPGLP